MKKRSLIFGTYNHILPGLSDDEFDRIYQTRLKPFLSRLNDYPRIPAVIHLSGTLLQRLESTHPEYLSLLKEMADRKQIELLGGGFAHPYLPLISQTDRLGQIEHLTTEIRRTLGKRPRGCVIPDFSWEQQLASTLQTAGMDYTFLRERQFIQAGISGDAPCVTEDQGRTLTVLPMLQTYESGLPRELGRMFADVEKRLKSEGGTVCLLLPGERVVDLDKGEKLDDFLKPLFDGLLALVPDCELTTPTKFLKGQKRVRRAYFGSASVREGIISSGKVANLYAKMHYTNSLVNQLRGDKARKKSAREEIWKAQDSVLYSPESDHSFPARRMMSIAYRSLLEAERITRDKGAFMPSIVETDCDFDGYDEYIYQGSDYNAYIHREGAVVTEFDVLSLYWNLLNLPESGSRKDCIFRDGISGTERERVFLVDGLYELENRNRSHSDILFSYEGLVGVGASQKAVRIEKRYLFRKNSCQIQVGITNIGVDELSGRYHSISQLSALSKESGAFKLSVKGSTGESSAPSHRHRLMEEVQSTSVSDEKGKNLYDLSPISPTSLYVEDITDSGETDRPVSGFQFDFSWPIKLKPTERFDAGLQLIIYPRRG